MDSNAAARLLASGRVERNPPCVADLTPTKKLCRALPSLDRTESALINRLLFQKSFSQTIMNSEENVAAS